MNISVEVDLKHLGLLIRNLNDGSLQLVRVTSEVMQKAMQVGVVYAKQNLSGAILGTRTGFLRNSIKSRVVIGDTGSGGGGYITGELGILKPKSGKISVYGAAQEFGGEAVPRRAKVMTLPLKAALTPTGVTRFTALEAKQLYDRTFWWNDVLYGVKANRGKGKRQRSRGNGMNFRAAVVGGKKQQRDKITPLFWGAHHVKIGRGAGVGRGYLRNARDRLIPPMREAIGRRIADILLYRASLTGGS